MLSNVSPSLNVAIKKKQCKLKFLIIGDCYSVPWTDAVASIILKMHGNKTERDQLKANTLHCSWFSKSVLVCYHTEDDMI